MYYEMPSTKKMRRQLCLEDCYQVRQARRQIPLKDGFIQTGTGSEAKAYNS